MPRQLSSALFASGTVPLTPTVTTCIVPTTFHPAARRADTSGSYFVFFLLTVLPDCRSEVHASSPVRTLTALRAPSGDVQCVTGPTGLWPPLQHHYVWLHPPSGGSSRLYPPGGGLSCSWLYPPGGGLSWPCPPGG
eukprot:6260144-Pyramimonas_sp.AAC.1